MVTNIITYINTDSFQWKTSTKHIKITIVKDVSLFPCSFVISYKEKHYVSFLNDWYGLTKYWSILLYSRYEFVDDALTKSDGEFKWSVVNLLLSEITST